MNEIKVSKFLRNKLEFYHLFVMAKILLLEYIFKIIELILASLLAFIEKFLYYCIYLNQNDSDE